MTMVFNYGEIRENQLWMVVLPKPTTLPSRTKLNLVGSIELKWENKRIKRRVRKRTKYVLRSNLKLLIRLSAISHQCQVLSAKSKNESHLEWNQWENCCLKRDKDGNYKIVWGWGERIVFFTKSGTAHSKDHIVRNAHRFWVFPVQSTNQSHLESAPLGHCCSDLE